MKILKTIAEMNEYVRKNKKRGHSLGFVPTMGCLHDGHLSLVNAAKEECAKVVVSIFVNPIQFGANEDFDKYPRVYKKDIRQLKGTKKVDCLFMPEKDELLPEGFAAAVTVDNELQSVLCGQSRPGHFKGVTTIVAKLLNIVRPEKLFLGQKDFQQTVILKKMIKDLDFDTQVKVCATVREKDGLAMSSRNIYLSPEERETAAVMYKALQMAESMIELGEHEVEKVVNEIKRKLKEANVKIDYIDILRAENLAEVSRITDEVVIAAAIIVGKTRLIDNVVVPVK
ncbi:MAG: pantoate--beta-alanine ligase [bacterium]